jgi:hypothetical protein
MHVLYMPHIAVLCVCVCVSTASVCMHSPWMEFLRAHCVRGPNQTIVAVLRRHAVKGADFLTAALMLCATVPGDAQVEISSAQVAGGVMSISWRS